MVFPLTSLPQEIIDSYVLIHLGADDIINLSACIPLTISKAVYHHAFGDNTNFSHYDLEMFKRRARASLYVVGSLEANCKDFPEHYEMIASLFCEIMHTPWRIENVGTIVDVVTMCGSVEILTATGELYVTRSLPGNPYTIQKTDSRVQIEDDYDKGRSEVVRRENLQEMVQDIKECLEEDLEYIPRKEDVDELRHPLPPPSLELLKASNRLFSQPYKIPRFVHIMGEHAVDDHGVLWRRAYTGINTNPVCLRDRQNGHILQGNVLLLRKNVYCFEHSCLVENVGVVILKAGAHFSPEMPNGIRSGYRCLNDHLCYYNVEVIPDTINIVDYTLTRYAVVYLRSDGTIGIACRSADVSSLHAAFIKFNSLAPFSSIHSYEDTFHLVTASGAILEVIMIKESPEMLRLKTRIIDLPFSTSLASLAVGESHCLALTEEGDVYSWGTEHDGRGYLGLGRLKDAIKLPGVHLGNNFRNLLVAEKPTKIKLPGKVMAIFSGNLTSAFLVDDGR